MSRLAIVIFNLLMIHSVLAQSADPKTKYSYVALGDSYTIGESVSEKERWPNQLAETFRKRGIEINKPIIIATTGWRTDDLKNAIEKAQLASNYSLVSLLIGVNNQYQGKSAEQYGIEFEDLLKTAIRLASGKKENVFVVSIPDYGFTPFGMKKQSTISNEIDIFNSINKQLTEKLGVRYINITDISRKGLEQPELVAHDQLHPSGKMYSLWVERIAKVLEAGF